MPPEATAYPKPVLTTYAFIIPQLTSFVNSFFEIFWNIFCGKLFFDREVYIILLYFLTFLLKKKR